MPPSLEKNAPRVFRASVLGYCFGVRRAIETAKNARKDFPDAHVCTYGPLIHNPAALSFLESERVFALPENCPPSSIARDSVVVIRAHGIPPAVKRALSETVSRVLDASCPRVLANQKLTSELSQNGHLIIIAGDKKHAETIAIAGCAEHSVIIENRAEAEAFIGSHEHSFVTDRLALIAQTTISRTEFNAIADALKTAFPNITVCDTICPATLERQNALETLCADVDGVLVIGGKSSANTTRLFTLAQSLCERRALRVQRAALIENYREIPREFFSLEAVGLTAGASTPDEVITEVERAFTL